MLFSKQFLSLLTLLSFATCSASAQTSSSPSSDGSGSAVKLDPFVITDELDNARESIVPSLGATSFQITSQQIETIPQGPNAAFGQVLLRAPGVAADAAGSGGIHVRGEHANLQYRINDVLLPEGISGFGLELDPRFVGSLQLVTGSLPAQYGFRTAGIVDIHTKNGSSLSGGDVSLFGGSFASVRPAFEVGSGAGDQAYFANGSYSHSELGIENPTSSRNAIHDKTDQSKWFGYYSHVLDASTRFNVMVSASISDFEVPNTPGLPAGTSPNGDPWLPGSFDSAALNETQREQNYYLITAFQKSLGELNYQFSAFARESSVHFTPDVMGDLYFNGVASDVKRTLTSLGVQGDLSYAMGSSHTVRAGW